MTTRTSPIFVKTPQPDTEERLVLVPPGAVVREYESQAGPRFDLLGCVARDATPADLVRAVDADAHDQLARHYRETIGKLQAATTRAEKAESDRNELVAILVELFGWEDTSFLHAILHVENAVLNQRADLAVEKARAEKAEATAKAGYVRHLDTLTPIREAIGAPDNADTLEWLKVVLARQDARAEKAERERDEALGRAQSETEWRVRAVSERQDAEVERDDLRAELARLTAPGEGSPDNGELVAAITRGGSYRAEDFDVLDLQEAYRLGGVAMGAKGHSIGCKCGRRSPATKDEDATIDAAQDAGWQVDGVNDCTEDVCPKCQRARLTTPGEGSVGEMTLAVKAYSGHGDHETSLLRVYRLGVAHERARQATDPRLKGRTIDVMLDECEDLEALEQDAYVAPKSREGLSLARKIAKLYAAAQHAEARQQQPEAPGLMAAAQLIFQMTEFYQHDAPGLAALNDVRRAILKRAGADPNLQGSAAPLPPVTHTAQPVQGRATDEELVDLFRVTYYEHNGAREASTEAGTLAVAAHVRKECFVAQAVALKVGVSFWPCDAGWCVSVRGALSHSLPPADVPATLSRMLGEVSQ